MKDKNGKRIRTGDLIQFDEDFLPGIEPLRVRYERKWSYGLIAEFTTGNPTPQRIEGLGHRFTKIAKQEERKA